MLRVNTDLRDDGDWRGREADGQRDGVGGLCVSCRILTLCVLLAVQSADSTTCIDYIVYTKNRTATDH